VNQAPITGESLPVDKQTGNQVFAGTLNGEGSLVITATSAAGDTTLARIARLVDEARAARSPTERFVDQFASRYTPAVIALALAVMIVPLALAHLGVDWAASVGAIQWVHRGLVLLVIACPCALVISTPVTIVSGLYRATRSGILVKGGEFLEKAAGIRRLALDKTGTVTTGALRVVGIETFNGHSTDEMLKIAAALERHSEHPIAAAISTAAAERGIDGSAIETVAARRGFGVQGDLDGETYFLGNPQLFRAPEFRWRQEDVGKLTSEANGENQLSRKAQFNAETKAWLGTRERLVGVVRMTDRPRPQTAAAMAELRRLGIERIVMLTGDNAATASAIGREIGIDEIHAELLPQDKIEQVRALTGSGFSAMVGDGVNDAPALAAADIGIALGGQASDTAMETADVVIMHPDLMKVAELIRLGRRCRRLLKQNIAFSLATKLAVIALAAVGVATMWMAVLADVGASLIVIANGMRMIGKR
jgi:Cd2+/Zn2+-exporting ATPase